MAKKKAPPAKKKPTRKKPAAKRPAHRPSMYSEALAQRVCALIGQGFTLRQIQAQPGMPNKATICTWLATNDEFHDQYARAHEVKAMMMEDEILDIVDDSRNDWVEREGKDGEPVIVLNDEAIQRSRVRVEARKWLMGKAAPKRYGDRVALTGKDGGPLEHTHRAIGGILDELGQSGADTGTGASG